MSTPEEASDGPTPSDDAATEHYVCPVCGYDGLAEPPYNADGGGSFEICPSCGFEFGYDDQSEGVSHVEYRERWLEGGAEWFDPDFRPEGWDLATQLARIGIEPDAG